MPKIYEKKSRTILTYVNNVVFVKKMLCRIEKYVPYILSLRVTSLLEELNSVMKRLKPGSIPTI